MCSRIQFFSRFPKMIPHVGDKIKGLSKMVLLDQRSLLKDNAFGMIFSESLVIR